jgi:hypothetical protein
VRALAAVDWRGCGVRGELEQFGEGVAVPLADAAQVRHAIGRTGLGQWAEQTGQQNACFGAEVAGEMDAAVACGVDVQGVDRPFWRIDRFGAVLVEPGEDLLGG